MALQVIAVYIGTAAVSSLVTAALLRWQNRFPVLDVPNVRSSHAHPKPRTGGIALLAATVTGCCILPAAASLPPLSGAWWGGAMFFFALGFLDDLWRLRVRTRLPLQFIASLLLAFYGPCLEALPLPGLAPLPLTPGLGLLITTFWYTGFVNLFNFMDGIDGLAASEAALVGLLMHTVAPAAAPLAASAAGAGFLLFNRQPARIFMGDGGSYLLGFVLAFHSVAASREAGAGVPFIVFVLFLGTFIADTTVTLLRRIANGEPFTESHRTHYYQQLTDMGFDHAQVTGMNLILTAFFGASGFAYAHGSVSCQIAIIFAWVTALAGVLVTIHWRRVG